MKAVRVHSPGGPEVLRIEDLPLPSPGPGQVLIRVDAAGVNFIIDQRSSSDTCVPWERPTPLALSCASVVVQMS